jgi:hypothetical protein
VSFYLAGVEFPLRACPNYFGTTWTILQM